MNKKTKCITDYNGTKRWCLNNYQVHRECGPAVIYCTGTKMWYINGQRHREDGPAVEFADGHKEWWLNGKIYSEHGFYKEIYKLGKISKDECFLHCI